MSDINTLMESLSKFNGKWPYQDAAEQLIKQQAEIISLREQVEKLTEAYDQCGRTVQDYGRTIGQTESRLREVATHCANVEQQLAALAEQNEKLTKERDTEIARNRPLQSLIKSQEEIKSFLLKKSEENKEAVKQLDSERQANALLTEELAALAEQNEKMRDALTEAMGWNWLDEDVPPEIGKQIDDAFALQNLATPVLNRIRAEGMRRAAKFCVDNPMSDAHCLAEMLRAEADELEKQNG